MPRVGLDQNARNTLQAALTALRRTALPPGLTPRQTQIARLLARGLSNKAIARDLGIAPATVKDNVATILSALDLPTRAAVAALFHPQNR